MKNGSHLPLHNGQFRILHLLVPASFTEEQENIRYLEQLGNLLCIVLRAELDFPRGEIRHCRFFVF